MADDATTTDSTEEVVTPVTEEESTETQETEATTGDETKETEDDSTKETEAETPAEDAKDETETDDEGESADESESDEEVDSKEQNRRGFAERTKLKQSVTKDIGPQIPTQTADELVEEGVDPAMAEVEALRQDVQREKVINHITDLNSGMNVDANSVLREFPVYDEKSKDYDANFAKDVETEYRKVANYETDESGNYVLRADVPLYDFYSFAARLRGSGTKAGARQGQKNAAKMMAATETAGSSGPKETKTTDDDLFLKGLKGNTTKNP